MKIVTVRIGLALLPTILALMLCFIAIGAPLEQGRGLPLANVGIALFSFGIGCCFSYVVFQNQISVDNEEVTFRRIFFERSYKINEIESISIFTKGTSNGGAWYYLKIVIGSNVFTHNVSVYKYKDVMEVVETLLKKNPSIMQEMDARRVILEKPKYW